MVKLSLNKFIHEYRNIVMSNHRKIFLFRNKKILDIFLLFPNKETLVEHWLVYYNQDIILIQKIIKKKKINIIIKLIGS